MPTQQAKINIALLFGGSSSEHEISIQSAKGIYGALDQDKYSIHLIGIDKQGRWALYPAEEFTKNTFIKMRQHSGEISLVTLLPGNDAHNLINAQTGTIITTIDVAFPILHGPYGEDGTIQGFLDVCHIPYVGAKVLSSAVCMDKDIMKQLFVQAGLATSKWITVRRQDLTPALIERVSEQLAFPCFVKPANTGSSIGIDKVKQPDALIAKIENAFQYDDKVLIEEYIQGREIECAVLQKAGEPPQCSVPGEVIPGLEFYSYEAKYDENCGTTFNIPAPLPHDVSEQLQQLAITTYQACGISDLARVDFFVTEDNQIWLNEINTLPGFTPMSQYPKLWQASGLPYQELLNNLIEAALSR